MKDKRIISLKNPNLRKIRNEMRELLILARNTKRGKIRSEMKEISSNEEGDSIPMDELTPSQLKRFRELQRLESKNKDIGRKSICLCYNCGKSDLDMYYNYPYRAWFCVECVNFLKSAHSKMRAKKIRGEYTCDPNDEFGQSFL